MIDETILKEQSSNKLLAILWDFDGTIVDSKFKNFAVNRRIFSELKQKPFPKSLNNAHAFMDAYQTSIGFYDFYQKHLDYSDAEIVKAAELWSQYQEDFPEKIHLIEQIPNVLDNLKAIPHAICSLNCSKNIKKILDRFDILHYFNAIIGHADLALEESKPHPAGFMKCLGKLDSLPNEGIIIYIGDHEQDTVFAKNGQKQLSSLGKNITVISIAATYCDKPDINTWAIKPDYIANSSKEIYTIVKKII